MTRSFRSKLEQFYVKKCLDYARQELGTDVVEVEGQTDSPDLAICTPKQKIAVELTQIPSAYIIKHFHRKLSSRIENNRAVGDLYVFPYEPHRWIHSILVEKYSKAEIYRNNSGASGVWLVLHSHSTTENWPMSNYEDSATSKFEVDLLKFGANKLAPNFDRIVMLYANGKVRKIYERGDRLPSAITVRDFIGYPAVTSHQINVEFAVAKRRMSQAHFSYHNIFFREHVIPPKDNFFVGHTPAILRPRFDVDLTPHKSGVVAIVSRDGQVILEEPMPLKAFEGERMNFCAVFHSGIWVPEYDVQF